MRTLALLLMIAIASPLAANIVLPEGYAGNVRQLAQQGVVIHRASTDDQPGYEELILRVVPAFDGDETPSQAVWIITLPSKPVRYEVTEREALKGGPALHEKLYGIARQQWDDRTQFHWPEEWTLLKPGREAKGPADPVTEIEPEGGVGPYQITEIEGIGQPAVDGLNAYLRKHGFPATQVGDYFIENDFSFLCVRITPPKGETRLDSSLDLPPIVVGFETDQPYYPAMFSASQGSFALDLTLITDTPLKSIPLERVRYRVGAERRGYVHLLNLWSVQAVPEGLADPLSERATEQPRMWHVNRIESFGVNEEEGIASWEDDVYFELGDNKDSLAGFWYYGDDDITFAERFFREHALAIMAVFSLILFGGLFIKTRINRKRFKAEQAARATT